MEAQGRAEREVGERRVEGLREASGPGKCMEMYSQEREWYTGSAEPKDREKRASAEIARPEGDARWGGRDWDVEDIIRVEKPTPRTITEKLCLILPTDPASAIVILHFAPLRFSTAFVG